MQKVVLILFVFIIGTSCAVIKKTERITTSSSKSLEAVEIELASENVTEKDFFIRKAEIEIREGEEKQKLIANLKYKKSGVFLMSLRSSTGIEIVRVYSDSDSVKINDRMNKRVYLGSANVMFGKYGIEIKSLPIILGDFINGKVEGGNVRIGEYIHGTGMVGSSSLEYTIDKRMNKVIRTKIKDSSGNNGIVIDFSDFIKVRDFNYAREIKVQSTVNDFFVEIKLYGIALLEEDIQEFIPGRNYEKILLK